MPTFRLARCNLALNPFPAGAPGWYATVTLQDVAGPEVRVFVSDPYLAVSPPTHDDLCDFITGALAPDLYDDATCP